MSKVKVLLVVGSLCRAGAERFAYEIDRALDKNKIQTTVFCLELENEISGNWKERYYDKKHLELGTPIVYKDKFLDKKKTFLNRLEGYLFRKLKITKPKKPNSDLVNFLNSFDVIHWMGEYTFIHSIPKKSKEKSLIHSMSAKFQDIHLYDSYDFNYPYHFISGFRMEDGEYSEFRNINHTYFPLVMNIVAEENRWKFEDNKIKKIGIFTRLDKYKPLDPFFYAFQLLLDQMPNCELHIYGNGNPKAEGMISYLERLGITDKVFFRGHQEDIVKTANAEHLDVSWFQGYNNDRPSGFAGLDICTTGTPLICWDFHAKPFNSFSPIYPHFKNLNNFVSYSLEILKNKEKAGRLSVDQFTDVTITNNINNYISDLENLYENFSKRK
jgi:glycosyltransferase involved in cell wall biosynthesis